ncbi:MAG: hypothetical protein RMM31_09280 [Anaerolineae bacterium]|nr:hypothetical protein [Thermoflexales bacterium]MDW8396419.1 hypothetical protein [Anaerolineae bacterium]
MPARRAPLDLLASLGGLRAVLEVLREVDVRPAQLAAERPFTLIVVSRDLPLAEHLVRLLYQGDRAEDVPSHRAAIALPLDAAVALARADVALIVAAAHLDFAEERRIQQALAAAGIPVRLCLLAEGTAPGEGVWLPTINGVLDEREAVRCIVQAVREMGAVSDLALARHLPAFRAPVVRALIDDVASANLAYSLGTAVLEVNPVTGLPLNVADVVVLTKNQGVMAYKIALAMGLPSDFRHIAPQLVGVIGGGFLLRQLARSLVGLIPAVGALTKVAVAFAGTYVVGEAVYRWCATGERLSEEALLLIYARALERGRALLARLRRLRLPSRRAA